MNKSFCRKNTKDTEMMQAFYKKKKPIVENFFRRSQSADERRVQIPPEGKLLALAKSLTTQSLTLAAQSLTLEA